MALWGSRKPAFIIWWKSRWIEHIISFSCSVQLLAMTTPLAFNAVLNYISLFFSLIEWTEYLKANSLPGKGLGFASFPRYHDSQLFFLTLLSTSTDISPWSNISQKYICGNVCSCSYLSTYSHFIFIVTFRFCAYCIDEI